MWLLIAMIGTESSSQHALVDLQEHFRRHKPAKTAEQRDRQRQQLLAQVPEEQRALIDETMLGAATGRFQTCIWHVEDS